MKVSIKKGFSFGLTSGIITTLGLIVGLYSSTKSELVIVGGIAVIAIADAMSDALGIHISEESEEKHSNKEVWESTVSTFISKFIFSLTFILPILFLQLNLAVMVSVIWGLLLIAVFSYYIARQQNAKPLRVISEHIILTLIVIILTNYIGRWLTAYFQ